MSRSRSRSKKSPIRRIERLELRCLMASDLIWNNPYWDGSTKLEADSAIQADAFYQSGDSKIALDISSNRLVIGKGAGQLDLPTGFELVKNVGNNAAIYESAQLITPSLIASIEALPGVEYTTPVYVNQTTLSDLTVLNEVIVSLGSGENAEAFFARESQFSSYKKLDGSPDQYVATMRDGFGKLTIEAAETIATDGSVNWASPNFYQDWEKFFTPNDPRFSNQWNLDNFGQAGGLVDADSDLPEAWDVIPGGSANIVIGIIDDGIEATHPDLRIWTNPGETEWDEIDNDGNGWVDDIRGWNFVADTNESQPTGDDSHGTSAAGVAAARGNNGIGVAGASYLSQVMALKIFDGATVASEASIASAIYYAAGRTRDGLGTWKAADLVSMSWGAGSPSTVINDALLWGTTNGRQGSGAPYFIASGNNNGAVSEPAAQSANIPGVFAVGASNNFGNRSSYSNFGPELDFVTSSSDTWPTYLTIDSTDIAGAKGATTTDYTGINGLGFGGTSSAAALGSGIAALVLAQADSLGITLSPSDLKLLFKNATDLVGNASYDINDGTNIEYGYGRLNAAAALLGLDKAEISVVDLTTEYVDRSNVGFDPVAVGQFSERVLRIRNQGTKPLDLGNVDMTGPFVFRNLGASTLNIGESTTLTLRFIPTALGSFSGKAIIHSNDLDESLFELNLFGTALTASISGTVFEDYDGDGSFKYYEDFLDVPGALVYLDDNDDDNLDPSETTTPIVNGGFAFDNLPAGTYVVRSYVPGWTVTYPEKNRSLVKLLNAGDSITGINFALSKNNREYAFVYEEINQDGVQNPGEPPLEGFVVSGEHRHFVSSSLAAPIPIPTSGSTGTISHSINVDVTGTILDLDVVVNISHTWDSDLTLTLTGPDGTTILLAGGVGGSGDGFANTNFNDSSPTSITQGSAPFNNTPSGSYRPQQALSIFNTMDLKGLWTLTIVDAKNFDVGTLNGWALVFQRRFYDTSDKNGWALVDLPTPPVFQTNGPYDVGVELKPDWLYSRPSSGFYTVTPLSVPIYDKPYGIFYDNVPPDSLSLSNATIPENQPIGTLIADLSSTDPNRFDKTFTYTLVSAPRPNDNALFRISGGQLLSNASYNYEGDNSLLVRIRTTDTGGEFLEREFTITITDVNDTPAALAIVPSTIVENSPIGSIVGALVTTDEDVGDTHTLTFVTGAGSTDNARFMIVNGNLVTNTLLNFETKNSYAVRIRTTDLAGAFLDRALTVTVLDDNEVASLITMTNRDVPENSGVGFTVGQFINNDPDAGDTFTYSLVSGVGSTGNGDFQIVGNTLLTLSDFNFEAQDTYTIRVKVRDRLGLEFETPITIHIIDVNEAPTTITLSNDTLPENELKGYSVGVLTHNDPDLNDVVLLSILPTDDYKLFKVSGNSLITDVTLDFEAKSVYSITVEAKDREGLFTQQQFFIFATDVNEAPIDISVSPNTVFENSGVGTLVGTVSALDVDAGDSYTLQLVSGAGDTDNSKFQLVGNQLSTTVEFDFETQNLQTIRVRATDFAGLWFEKAITVDVLNVNENPTGIKLTPATVNERLPVNSLVGILSTIDVDLADTYTYELVSDPAYPDNSKFHIVGDQLQTGAIFDYDIKSSYTLLVESKDNGGLAVTKTVLVTVLNINDLPTDIGITKQTVAENLPVATPIGLFTTVDLDQQDTFTYSLVAGAGDSDNGSFTIIGNELRTGRVFNFEAKSNYSIRVQSKDSGGATIQKALAINVTNTNESPTGISLSNNSVFENSALGSTVGALSTQDPDLADTFTYTFVSGTGSADNAKFTLVGNSLKTNTALDFETTTSYSVRIKSTDANGLSVEAPFTISVLNLNEAPFNFNVFGTLTENTPSGTVVAVANASDQDANDVLSYLLVAGQGDTDNASFSLSTIGELKILVLPNYEAKSVYNIRARVSDKAGLSVDKTFSLNVLDVNEAPTQLALSASTIEENKPAGTTVGVFSTLDPDNANTFIYSFASGLGSTDNASFAIVGNELRAVGSFDFESKPTYSVRVKSTDNGGLGIEQVFTISVGNVNEAPSSVSLSNTTLVENQPSGTLVGLISTVDTDANETFIYSLVAGAGSTDNGSFSIVNNRLETKAAFDFETKSSFGVRIRSTDKGGLWTESAYVIQVQDANDLPTGLSLSSLIVDENLPAQTLVGTLTSTDQDTQDTVTYRFVSGANDNAAFVLQGTNKDELRLVAPFNFESKSIYQIDVQAIDKSFAGPIKSFTITVKNVNDPVVDVVLSTSTVSENAVVGTVVGILSTVDEDVADSHQFSLVSGTGSADNSKFTIVGNELRLAEIPNFETQPTYSVRIRGVDAGGLAFEKSFSINVFNLPEAPTSVAISNASIKENAASNTLVGTLTATDPDVGDILSYSLVTGQGSTDNALFSLNGAQLLARNAFNFEIRSSYSVRVRATDQTGRLVEAPITIAVTNENETPTGISISADSIRENNAAGTLVGRFTSTDPDSGDSFTYSLVPSPTTGDNAKFQIVGNELRSAAKFNFETKPTYQVTVRSTDANGLFTETPFTILVSDVVEVAPRAVADSGAAPVGLVTVLDVLANDTDQDGTIDPATITIVSQPSAGSVRVLANGKVEFTPPTDRRLTTSFTYSVKDNDEVLSNVGTVTVKVHSAFQNQNQPLDVDADGEITPLDVLTLVNDINTQGLRTLPTGVPATAPYLDTNGNGETDPLDVLEVVNYLNALAAVSGEGEGEVVEDLTPPASGGSVELVQVKKVIQDLDPSLVDASYYDEFFRELSLGKKRR